MKYQMPNIIVTQVTYRLHSVEFVGLPQRGTGVRVLPTGVRERHVQFTAACEKPVILTRRTRVFFYIQKLFGCVRVYDVLAGDIYKHIAICCGFRCVKAAAVSPLSITRTMLVHCLFL